MTVVTEAAPVEAQAAGLPGHACVDAALTPFHLLLDTEKASMRAA